MIRVLIVDDHPMVTEGIKAILETYDDIDVVGALANGQEALDAIDSLTPDVVLMDLNMPGMNGLEFYRTLQRQRPDLIERLAFATGDLDEEVDALIHATSRPRLFKPFQADDLFDMIEQLSRG